MSGAGARLNVVPTVTVLAGIKIRLAAATKGYQLLKKKSDALTMRYRQILKEIVAAKRAMGDNMREAAFALTEVNYAAGDSVKHAAFENVGQATVKVRPPPRTWRVSSWRPLPMSRRRTRAARACRGWRAAGSR